MSLEDAGHFKHHGRPRVNIMFGLFPVLFSPSLCLLPLAARSWDSSNFGVKKRKILPQYGAPILCDCIQFVFTSNALSDTANNCKINTENISILLKCHVIIVPYFSSWQFPPILMCNTEFFWHFLLQSTRYFAAPNIWYLRVYIIHDTQRMYLIFDHLTTISALQLFTVFSYNG